MRRGAFVELGARLGYSAQVVLVDQQEYERYYYDAGVNIIWSTWHGIEDDVPARFNTESPLRSLASYIHVNRQMAARVADVAAAGAVVAVQDYQFMLAPAMIRALRPDLRIVYFNHVPFPDAASLANLPSIISSTLVYGMLGADLLGFQRGSWAHRFLRCCQALGLRVDPERGRIWHRGRVSWTRCYPVVVDVPSLTGRLAAPEVCWWAVGTAPAEGTVRIVRVDRLDPAKNALRGFEAYALLLRRRPALAGIVQFLACLVPSRERMPEYRHYASRVRRVIEEVNLRHPGAITVYYGEDQDRALGVLNGYDVLLVNSVADGMNLVAQEGAVANSRDGAVVLSRETGSADLLSGAVILTRPRDVVATADALEAALALSPAERRERANRMRAAVSRGDAAQWLNRQIADALAVSRGSAPHTPPSVCAEQDARLP
jgi:trehalose 6-phosphate synthase